MEATRIWRRTARRRSLGLVVNKKKWLRRSGKKALSCLRVTGGLLYATCRSGNLFDGLLEHWFLYATDLLSPSRGSRGSSILTTLAPMIAASPPGWNHIVATSTSTAHSALAAAAAAGNQCQGAGKAAVGAAQSHSNPSSDLHVQDVLL